MDSSIIPKSAVDAILQARQAAAAAEQSANVCRMKASEMEHILCDNTDAYHKAIHECLARTDRIQRMEQANRTTAIILVITAVLNIVAALMLFWGLQ